MKRFFNTQGPCDPSRHYMLPATARLPDMQPLIERGMYLVLHAPRQVGKTTALRALAQELTATGRYVAAVLSMEAGAPYSSAASIGLAEQAILENWRADARAGLRGAPLPPPWPTAQPGSAIRLSLAAWAEAAPLPLVLFLDEIDALQGPVLISVLRQLRAGHADRPARYPWSIALCGMRDVRDYQFKDGEAAAHGASPFNVKESLTMRLFTAAEVADLYRQHTADTGQPFTDDAVTRAFELSAGQPWLVNALAAQLVDALVPERSQALTARLVDRAKEAVILRRETHLDSLMERLREPRVRRVLEPILTGSEPALDVVHDDLLYARDLGLITPQAPVRIANPIYQEIIPRALSFQMQEYADVQGSWYRQPDGTLDMVLLLASFQEFFAQHSEAWLSRFDYQEAGPHLMLMAYLQRVVNGGGRISREFGAGRGRADLVVEVGGRRSVIELKLRRGEGTVAEGIAQLSGYLERLGESEGFLVIFDRRKGRRWADKIYIEEQAGLSGERIYVVGM